MNRLNRSRHIGKDRIAQGFYRIGGRRFQDKSYAGRSDGEGSPAGIVRMGGNQIANESNSSSCVALLPRYVMIGCMKKHYVCGKKERKQKINARSQFNHSLNQY
jgi:hypothetical protein